MHVQKYVASVESKGNSVQNLNVLKATGPDNISARFLEPSDPILYHVDYDFMDFAVTILVTLNLLLFCTI